MWTASAVSTLGNGVYLAALPLLAAELTSDPLPVALVAFAMSLRQSIVPDHLMAGWSGPSG